MAKNVKRNDPVYVLMNREVVEAVSGSLYNQFNGSEKKMFILYTQLSL